MTLIRGWLMPVAESISVSGPAYTQRVFINTSTANGASDGIQQEAALANTTNDKKANDLRRVCELWAKAKAGELDDAGGIGGVPAADPNSFNSMRKMVLDSEK